LNSCVPNQCGDTYVNEVDDVEQCESEVDCFEDPEGCTLNDNDLCTLGCQLNVCGDGLHYDPYGEFEDYYDDFYDYYFDNAAARIQRGGLPPTEYEYCDLGDDNRDPATPAELVCGYEQEACLFCSITCVPIVGSPGGSCGDEIYQGLPDEECEPGIDESECDAGEICLGCTCQVPPPTK